MNTEDRSTRVVTNSDCLEVSVTTDSDRLIVGSVAEHIDQLTITSKVDDVCVVVDQVEGLRCSVDVSTVYTDVLLHQPVTSDSTITDNN